MSAGCIKISDDSVFEIIRNLDEVGDMMDISLSAKTMSM